MIKRNFLTWVFPVFLTIISLSFFTQCSEDEIIAPVSHELSPGLPAPDTTLTANPPEGPTYTVPADARTIDGEALGLTPGTIIELDASVVYGNLKFVNIVGSEGQPIVIRSSGGTARINGGDQSYAVKFQKSKYFRFTGGDADGVYDIKIDGGHLGMTLEYLSTDFEVDHVEITNIGFAGLMAKTDPSCDDATIQGNFTMTNISIHDNFVHDTGGEGFYVGNSLYEKGMQTPCGIRQPHEIHNVKVYNNKVKNSGWEGIQVGSATQGAMVFNNQVENYGMANKPGQNNGMQIGSGTGGVFFNNFIKNGNGNGLIMMGLGDNVVHDNVIVNAGENGIFCDERRSPGPGYQFINNTIVSPGKDGIRLYSDEVPVNVVLNNIIVNPGSVGDYADEASSFIFRQNGNVNVQSANNFLSRDVTTVRFLNAAADDYRLTPGSPAIDAGSSIDTYNIAHDFYGQPRFKGVSYDIGAGEF